MLLAPMASWLVLCSVIGPRSLTGDADAAPPAAAAGSLELPLGADSSVVQALPATGALGLTLQAHAGDFVHLIVRATAPASLRISAESGETLFQDELSWETSELHYSAIRDRAGAVRVELRLPKGDTPSTVQVLSVGPRKALPADPERVQADVRFAQGVKKAAGNTAAAVKEGLVDLQGALDTWVRLGDEREQWDALLNIGFVLGNIGESAKSIEALERCVALGRKLGDPHLLPEPLEVLGGELVKKGDAQGALVLARESAEVRGKLGDREALALWSIANDLAYLDRFNEEVDALTLGLAKARAVNDQAMEAMLVGNRGSMLSRLGEWERAIPDLEQALAWDRLSSNRAHEGGMLHSLGVVQQRLGHADLAEKLFAQEVELLHDPPQPARLATAYSSLAGAQIEQGKLDLARKNVLEAQAAAGPKGPRKQLAVLKAQLASLEFAQGHTDASKALVAELLPDTRELSYLSWELITLRTLARLELGFGEVQEALRLAQRVVELEEQERRQLLGEGVRAHFLAARQRDYRVLIDVLLELNAREPGKGWDARALEGAERARARGLLDLIEEAQIDLRAGVDPKLLEQEKEAALRLSRKGRELAKVRGKGKSDELTKVEAEYAALSTEHEQLDVAIRAHSPRMAALTQAEPLSLSELQQQVLDKDTLLVEVALGESRGAVFVVGPESLSTFALGKRTDLEAAARAVHEAWSDPDKVGEAEVARRGAALSKMLFGEAQKVLGKKRLLFVSEGALQFVPLGALPTPGVKGAARPLLADHEIVSLPSASTLAVLRRELSARAPAEGTVAVIADPVFDAQDPRVQGRGAPAPEKGKEPEQENEKPAEPIGVAMLTRSAGDVGVQRFERLSGTREEANEIVRLAGKGHALLALDFDANLATARDGQLAKYRLVHFATHGLLDSKHPELSGLLLSTVDARGHAQDGFLQLRDVYGLRLAADLVVLSACQTALGAQVWGEGVVGLVRGFMYAGAPRVVASSWRVPDRATAALMKRFYEGMLARKLTAAAALREAQLFLWKSRKFSAPRDWAGFTLQGEWR